MPAVDEAGSEPNNPASHASERSLSAARRPAAVSESSSTIAARTARKRRSGHGPAPVAPANAAGATGAETAGSVTASESLGSRLPCSDADDRVDRRDPHLSVADLARLRRLGDHVDDVARVGIVDEDLQAELRHQVHRVLRPAVDLGVPL